MCMISGLKIDKACEFDEYFMMVVTTININTGANWCRQ